MAMTAFYDYQGSAQNPKWAMQGAFICVAHFITMGFT